MTAVVPMDLRRAQVVLRPQFGYPLMENSLRALICKANCSCRGRIRGQLTGCMCIVSASTPQHDPDPVMLHPNYMTQTSVSFKIMALSECCQSLSVMTYLLGTWLPPCTNRAADSNTEDHSQIHRYLLFLVNFNNTRPFVIKLGTKFRLCPIKVPASETTMVWGNQPCQ